MIRVGLILAAGRSARFGAADKLLANHGGRPLACHAAGAMRSVNLDHRLVVVANAALAPLFEGFDVIAVPVSGGQGDNLAAGARHARRLGADKLLIALADMPNVTCALLSAVLARCEPDSPAAATDGNRAMPPACFPARFLPQLAALTGDRGARSLLAGLPDSALVASQDGELADVDTPGDLERLRGTS